MAILTGVKRLLIVVLTNIFVVISDVDNFMYLLDICIYSLETIYLGHLSILKLTCLFFTTEL